MDNISALNIIRAYRADSLGVPGDRLSRDRESGLDRYHGRPYGDEESHGSKVVSKDIAETVDWIMPALIETFVAGGEVVVFNPIGAEDESAAEQETAYVNHVIMKDNDGVIVIHDAIFDAILLKNGYFKHYFDESEVITEREYKDQTEIQMAQIRQELKADGAEVEDIEHDERIEEETVQGPQGPIVIKTSIFDTTLRITKKVDRIIVIAVPVEEVRVSKRCKGSLQTSPFTEHVPSNITRTDLLEMGMSKKFVMGLTKMGGDDNHQSSAINNVAEARESDSNQFDNNADNVTDPSMDIIEYSEAYVKMDYDDDGKAELRRVVIAGGQIPPGKEWNQVIDTVPMTGFTSKRMAHRHEGISIDDDIKELQRIKTTLERQLLDNIYRTTHVQTVVNQRMERSDLVDNVPGGFLQTKDDLPVDGAFMPIPIQSIADKILPAVDMIDGMISSRTGINETTTNQDPNVLKAANNEVFAAGLKQASQIVRMRERMIAEMGIKELSLRVHELIIKHPNRRRNIKLTGNYIDINPSEWRERTDMTVKVGLGTGTQDDQRRNLSLLASLQQSLEAKGLVTPEKSFRLFKDVAKTLGELNPDKYAVDPTPDENGQSSQEYQQLLQKQKAAAQNQQNPLAEAEQVKAQGQAQIAQLKSSMQLELDRAKLEFGAQLAQFKQQSESVEKERDRLDKERERHHKEQMQHIKIHSDEAQKTADLEVKALIEGLRVDLGQPGIGTGLQDG